MPANTITSTSNHMAVERVGGRANSRPRGGQGRASGPGDRRVMIEIYVVSLPASSANDRVPYSCAAFRGRTKLDSHRCRESLPGQFTDRPTPTHGVTKVGTMLFPEFSKDLLADGFARRYKFFAPGLIATLGGDSDRVIILGTHIQ
jgi:hypothetical protein